MRVIVTVFALFCAFAGLSYGVASADEHLSSHAAFSNMAPADEYFGRLKESILEIRNRLDDLDRRNDEEMLDSGTRHSLDDLQDAVRDWQHKYPNDPWLPQTMRRLLREYQRAGAASTPEAMEVVAVLQANYGDTETAMAVSDVFAPAESPDDEDAPQAPQAVSIAGTVVDADSGQPIAGATIVVTSGDDGSDPSDAPSGTTAEDGSFVLSDVPATSLTLTIQPPDGSGYAPYTLTVDGSSGDIDAGVIRLSLE